MKSIFLACAGCGTNFFSGVINIEGRRLNLRCQNCERNLSFGINELGIEMLKRQATKREFADFAREHGIFLKQSKAVARHG